MNSEDQAQPEVKLELGGKERILKFNLSAMVAFKKATGKDFMDGTLKEQGMSASDFMALMMACLVDKSITEEQIGEWMNPSNMALVTKKLEETFEASMPEKGKSDEAPLPPSSTG